MVPAYIEVLYFLLFIHLFTEQIFVPCLRYVHHHELSGNPLVNKADLFPPFMGLGVIHEKSHNNRSFQSSV